MRNTDALPLTLSWRWFVVAFISYFVSGSLLSSLSTQSQIVPIWLPAGIALVGCYIWWWRFFPAVFIASLFFNLSTHNIQELAQVSQALLAEVTLIALGATLQAIIGSACLKYWFGNPLVLKSEKEILGFVVIVGVLVNLIAANFGVFALSQFNPSYNTDNYWQNMLVWWMGDSLGVVVGAPFILALVGFNGFDLQTRKSRLLIISISSLLFIMVSLSTLFFAKYSYNNALALAKRELQVIDNGLRGEISNNQSQLQLLSRFLQTNPELSREEFAAFSSELISGQSAIKALYWNPVINQQDIGNFVAKLQTIYQQPIIINGNSLSENDPMVVVKYINPEQGNENAIGFNVFSNPERRAALEKPLNPYFLRATPIIQLVQSNVAEAAYLLFAPVYATEQNSDSSDINKPQVIGYATGVFLVDQMLTQALRTAVSDIFWYELQDKNTQQVFAGNTQAGQSQLNNDVNLMTLTFDLSGQHWQMELVPKRPFLIHYQSDLSTLLYIFQILIVAFSIAFILLMNNRQMVLNHLVNERTNDLVLATQEAKKSNLAKGQFLANMSHELRTPLNAVLGFSQLAKKANDITILRSYLDKIASASTTLLALINDILDFSKIESEKLILEQTPFDMDFLLKKINSLFESSAKHKHIEWQVTNHLPANLWLLGDPLRLEQIITNICSNAIKFTHQGKVILSVNLLNMPKELNNGTFVTLQISVKDSGIGMNEEQLQNLFSAFTQADSSTTRKFGGTGLGLSISKKLCELMRGSCTVESQVNVGSVFTFQVPLQRCSAPKAFPLPTQIDLSELAGKHILVAEDNEINQLVVTEMLRSLAIETVIVENGLLAVEAATTQHFDLVLMDCQMPVLDGYEATKRIRRFVHLQQLPIIALTADVTQESKDNAKTAGLNAHLSKPISFEELTTCLLKFLVKA
ncbi:ATP-binding protein [Paraglaciecola hydrolytica]|uniref:ATP-binding protein n=1 Tax=Paraglaciecola hydrolytica TaxID=1799789 RepID=UPI0008390DEB|nr:ATP-binding protein [Paraglaciecola hydrolytica]